MIRFYSPDIETTLSLPPDEAKHCVRVLRHSQGDIIEVIDGCGNLYKCLIERIESKSNALELSILSKEYLPNPWKGRITIAIAPTKNSDRMEWLVEKLTEIGVDEIVLVNCEHSERKVLKTDRLERIMISAMKQSLKTHLPQLTPMTPYNDAIALATSGTDKYIAYCDSVVGKNQLCRILKPGKDAFILVGPEGDFSRSEVETALNQGFRAVSLGECRLRTETAAIVALDTFHIISSL